jgi:branched-chain amino acid transport system permease protein
MSTDAGEDGRRRIRLMKGLHLTPVQIGLAVLALVALFVVPDIEGLSDNLSLDTIHEGLLWGLAAVGLNLLLRHTELVSFGHAAFFGAGAYGGAIAVNFFGIDLGLILLLFAVLLALVLSVFIGWLVAEYRDIYFALLTLAFGQVLFAVALGSEALGQDEGLVLRQGGGFAAPPPTLFGIQLEPRPYRIILYYLTIVLLVISLLVMWRLINSPFGNALDAIGQNRTRARFIGIPVKRYVWAAFVISGLYGGIAGGLYGMLKLSVDPEATLEVFRSGEILFIAILGGFQTLLGPVLGGILLTWLDANGRFITDNFQLLTGAILIFVVFFLPRGILGSLPEITAGIRERARNPSKLGDDASALGTLFAKRLRDAAATAKILLLGVK